MNIREYQGIEPRMLTQIQAEQYTGLGRSAMINFGKRIGARRKIGRRVLYDKRVIDTVLDKMNVSAV